MRFFTSSILFVSGLLGAAWISACSSQGQGAATGTTGGGGGPSGGCHANADCDGGAFFCGVQILAPYCGPTCDQTLSGDGCKADADCADAGSGLICGTPCSCQHGGAQPEQRCTKGCATAADCGPSMACSATLRCVAATCAQPSDCTANFTCSAGQCAPKPCTKDSDCGNYCLNGRCSALLGSCNLAVP